LIALGILGIQLVSQLLNGTGESNGLVELCLEGLNLGLQFFIIGQLVLQIGHLSVQLGGLLLGGGQLISLFGQIHNDQIGSVELGFAGSEIFVELTQFGLVIGTLLEFISAVGKFLIENSQLLF